MANQVTYLASAANQTYSDAAFAYVGSTDQIEHIRRAALKLGISAGAIAGAMAEENHTYAQNALFHNALDLYATSRIDPIVAAVTLPAALSAGLAGITAWLAANAIQPAATERTHAEWVADYAAVGATADDPHSDAEKVLHPVLIDMGHANIKMATAIRLVNEYAWTYASLGLAKYTGDYALLAQDLIDPDSNLTAKLSGLMVKDAEKWFTDPTRKAHGADWANLPQVFKDALYVTYFNLGPKKLQEKFDEFKLANPGKPYEPQPALGTGGGMNHLLNAKRIRDIMGLDGYASTDASNDQAWRRAA